MKSLTAENLRNAIKAVTDVVEDDGAKLLQKESAREGSNEACFLLKELAKILTEK